jgi:hypothetical protein
VLVLPRLGMEPRFLGRSQPSPCHYTNRAIQADCNSQNKKKTSISKYAKSHLSLVAMHAIRWQHSAHVRCDSSCDSSRSLPCLTHFKHLRDKKRHHYHNAIQCRPNYAMFVRTQNLQCVRYNRNPTSMSSIATR